MQHQNMNQQASASQVFDTINQVAGLISSNNAAAQGFYNIFHPSMQQQQQQLQLQNMLRIPILDDAMQSFD